LLDDAAWYLERLVERTRGAKNIHVLENYRPRHASIDVVLDRDARGLVRKVRRLGPRASTLQPTT